MFALFVIVEVSSSLITWIEQEKNHESQLPQITVSFRSWKRVRRFSFNKDVMKAIERWFAKQEETFVLKALKSLQFQN